MELTEILMWVFLLWGTIMTFWNIHQRTEIQWWRYLASEKLTNLVDALKKGSITM